MFFYKQTFINSPKGKAEAQEVSKEDRTKTAQQLSVKKASKTRKQLKRKNQAK